MGGNVATELVEALSALWRRIQTHHPEVPDVVLLPAPGPRNVLGHFAPLRWKARGDAGATHHEVVVVAEHLSRRADEIAETVLHEAVHALNCARGVKDCSATSQYHNEHFKNAALEVGLTVAKVPNYGWAFTAMPPETMARYEVEIRRLADVLVHRRAPVALPLPPATGGSEDEGGDGGTPSDTDEDEKPKGRMLKATCKCGFIIRVARLTFETTTITCERCHKAFSLS